ncbi:unnamed protein product [Macrosiphum euphorbiae]|uniref:TTF-type domain-containing protein n=1 Tax=Macrosiphum euphorbiae TaxID=13131 RepID=A0AAV0WG34_9HEMI|nr:unnamed protein product [Macrosiphum euphorbiae]
MSSQRSGCEKRKRKACKEAELLKIKTSAENITDSISDSTKKIENKELHSDDASAENTTDSISDSTKKIENKELYSDDASADNTTDSISDSTKKIENKELHSDDASADNTTDSIFESSKKSENKELHSDDSMYFYYKTINLTNFNFVVVLMFLSTASAENTTDSISDSTKKIENKELHSDDASADNTTDSIFESSKKSENKELHSDDTSAENTTDSIFNSSKQSEKKELYSDDVNMVNVYDPVNPFSKDRLEFQNRILKGRYKPILDLYPRSLQNSKNRSFQKNWYDIFDWLEYSDASDKAFCFPCRCFKGNEINSSYSESTFSSNGFKAWYRAIDAFKKHQSSKCHLNSAKALTDFINLKSIDCVLNKNRLEEISRKEKDRLKNREFMNRIIDIIICLGKSGRPFRGHDEKSDSCNQGLFKELVILLTKYDVVLQDHLQEAPKNALYTSNRIQNDLITSIKNVILRNIKNNLQNSFISIMADETTDVGHFEQLSIVFRYFDEKKIDQLKLILH